MRLHEMQASKLGDAQESWWTKPQTREEFREEARKQFETRLAHLKLPRGLYPGHCGFSC